MTFFLKIGSPVGKMGSVSPRRKAMTRQNYPPDGDEIVSTLREVDVLPAG